MPKPLAKSFSNTFAFYSNTSNQKSLGKTAFTLTEIENIKQIFENANSYDEAYAKFEEEIAKKSNSSISVDPFVLAIKNAYKQYKEEYSSHSDTEDLFEGFRDNENDDKPEKNYLYLDNEKNQSTEDNPKNTESDDALQKEIHKEIGLKLLFYKLVNQFPHANSATYKSLNNITKEKDDIKITGLLQKILTIAIAPIVTKDLSGFDYEWKLIRTLLIVFMLSDKPTASEYQELIEHLIFQFTRRGKENFILPFENLILDLFTLRLKTLSEQKEINECKQFFDTVAKENNFEFRRIPVETIYLLKRRQSFTKTFYDESEFSSYQAFIEMLSDAMFYQKTPIKENAAIVSDLLEIGIQPLLEIKLNETAEKAYKLMGGYKLRVILPQIEHFLTFLLKIYQKSNLIPTPLFKNTIERLLLKQVELLPVVKHVDDVVEHNEQLGEIYAKYLELNTNRTDQEAFLKQLDAASNKLITIELTNETDYKKIVYQLMGSLNGTNYSFAKQRITSLLASSHDKVSKIIAELKGNLTPSESTTFQCKLIDDLDDIERRKASPFLSQLANLHPNSDNLWATPTWVQIGQIVAPFLSARIDNNELDDPFSKMSFLEKSSAPKNQPKKALISLLNYGLFNYGLSSQSVIPQKKPFNALSAKDFHLSSEIFQKNNYEGKNFSTEIPDSQDNEDNMPEDWKSFREMTAWLFLALHDPSNNEDKKLIANLTKKVGHGFPDKFITSDSIFGHYGRIGYRLSKSLGNLVTEYQLPCNEDVVEKLLTSMGDFTEKSLALEELLNLAPLFSQNKTLFSALLKVLDAKKPSLDFLKTLEPSELNREIVTYLIEHQLDDIKKPKEEQKVVQEEKPKEKKTPEFIKALEASDLNKETVQYLTNGILNSIKTQKEAPVKSMHDHFQELIIKSHVIFNQQGLETPESLLESYFSACKTPEDRIAFIQFLFEKLPTQKTIESEKNQFDYLTKTMKNFESVNEYVTIIHLLSNKINDQEELKTLLLDIATIASEKLSNSHENCFLLLEMMRLKISSAFKEDKNGNEKLNKIYSDVAKKYVDYLKTAFENFPISQELIKKAQTIGEELNDDLTTFISTFKKSFSEVFGRDPSKICLENHAFLEEKKQIFGKLRGKYQHFERTITESLKNLGSEIQETKEECVKSTSLTNEHFQAERKKLVKKNQLLGNNKKSYQLLKDFIQEAKNENTLAHEVTNYLSVLESSFLHLDKLFLELQKDLNDAADFSYNVNNKIESLLKNKSLAEQVKLLRKLHDDSVNSFKKTGQLLAEADKFLSENITLSVNKNQKIIESLAAHLDQINQRIARITQEIQENEGEKKQPLTSVGCHVEHSETSPSTARDFSSQKTLVEMKSELTELNKQKECLNKIHQSLLGHIHETKLSPLTTILYDDKLTNDSKINLLKEILSKNDITHYNPEINSDETIVATPIYHAVEKGTPEMLRIILEGMKGFTQQQKDDILNEKTNKGQEIKGKKTPMRTALHRAIELGDLEKVKLLVEAGCNLNASCTVGDSIEFPLIFESLRKISPSATLNDIKKPNWWGVSMPPLLFAYHLGKKEIAQYLLEQKNIDLNTTDNLLKDTLLYLVVLQSDHAMLDRLLALNEEDDLSSKIFSTLAIKQWDLETVDKLAKKSILRRLQVEQENFDGITPLCLAIIKICLPIIQKCIDTSQYQIVSKLVATHQTKVSEKMMDEFCFFGKDIINFLLCHAISHNDFELVMFLTKRKSYQHNFKSSDGETPLQLAARIGTVSILKCLWAIELQGSDVVQVNANCINALLTALTKRPGTDEETMQIIDFILSRDNFGPEKLLQNNGHFRLLTACVHNHVHLMALLNKGINPNAMNENNDTVLHHAAAMGDFKTVQLFVEQTKISFLHFQNRQKLTPLMLVYTSQTVNKDAKNKIVCYLIEKTSDLTDLFEKRDTQGNNILDLAVKANDLTVVKKLTEAKNQNLEKKKETAVEATSFALSGLLGIFSGSWIMGPTSTTKKFASLAVNSTSKIAEKMHAVDYPLNKISSAYNSAFHLAKSVEMIRYFVENNLVDIQKEAHPFIKKLELDTNNSISLEEKRKIVLYMAKKLFEKMIANSSSSTMTNAQELARSLAPWLFRTRESYSALPNNFDGLEDSLKIKTLKIAIEDQEIGTVAGFLNELADTKIVNSGVTSITNIIKDDGLITKKISNGEATIIEQIELLGSQIDISTKEKRAFWVNVALATKKKNLDLTLPSTGNTLLASLINEKDFENIQRLNEGGYLSNTKECEEAYALAYTAMYPAQENTTSQTTTTSTSLSESHQKTEETYKAVLGAVKNYLLPFLKNSEEFFIKRMLKKLDFKGENDCWLILNLLKEAKQIHASSYAMLWSLKDKNNLTIAQAVFENHPSLLAEFLRLSTVEMQHFSESASISNSQTAYSSRESMHTSMINFYDNQATLVENCKGAIGAVLNALRSQNAHTECKIEDVIIKALTSKEDINRQLTPLLGDLYIVGDYENLIKKERSKKLLVDEKGLEGNALSAAKTSNILVHLGCIIEAFKLSRLTQLPGAESKGCLFDHARNGYNPEKNRELYIETVNVCLEKWGITVPQLAPNPAVLHIPGPLQSSSSSTSSAFSTSSESSNSSATVAKNM